MKRYLMALALLVAACALLDAVDPLEVPRAERVGVEHAVLLAVAPRVAEVRAGLRGDEEAGGEMARSWATR